MPWDRIDDWTQIKHKIADPAPAKTAAPTPANQRPTLSLKTPRDPQPPSTRSASR